MSHVATGQRVDAVAAYLRERSGEPVQTDLAMGRTIPPAPMLLGTGTAAALR